VDSLQGKHLLKKTHVPSCYFFSLLLLLFFSAPPLPPSSRLYLHITPSVFRNHCTTTASNQCRYGRPAAFITIIVLFRINVLRRLCWRHRQCLLQTLVMFVACQLVPFFWTRLLLVHTLMRYGSPLGICRGRGGTLEHFFLNPYIVKKNSER